MAFVSGGLVFAHEGHIVILTKICFIYPFYWEDTKRLCIKLYFFMGFSRLI
jgi:hypothetical protein